MIGWLALATIVVGHFSLHLWIYNRLNATGLPRWLIKVGKYFFLATCVVIPCAVVWSDGATWSALLRGEIGWSAGLQQLASPWRWVYVAVCLGTLVIFAPRWLMSRPRLNRDTLSIARTVDRYSVPSRVERPLAQTRKARWFAGLPLNQLFELAIEQKELPVVGLPEVLDGLKIAHLSDIHLTGHVSPAFYRHVIERANQWQPDILAMTGDLVDKPHCIDWLGDCFGEARARDGCFFVLGNHDLRVPDSAAVRRAMVRLGWMDLGGQALIRDLRGAQVEWIGNESPWFQAPRISPANSSESPLRILLSHSPDQIQWARDHGVSLMMAGHTHGGQGRLPWIGPVLSPSFYGSRYASGSFYLEPTTMHVTRGLSGVHLMRINCPPELALLTLRSVDSETIHRMPRGGVAVERAAPRD